jgi:hypothetical protein
MNGVLENAGIAKATPCFGMLAGQAQDPRANAPGHTEIPILTGLLERLEVRLANQA